MILYSPDGLTEPKYLWLWLHKNLHLFFFWNKLKNKAFLLVNFIHLYFYHHFWPKLLLLSNSNAFYMLLNLCSMPLEQECSINPALVIFLFKWCHFTWNTLYHDGSQPFTFTQLIAATLSGMEKNLMWSLRNDFLSMFWHLIF